MFELVMKVQHPSEDAESAFRFPVVSRVPEDSQVRMTPESSNTQEVSAPIPVMLSAVVREE
jgi:hypothetical protein